MGFLGNIINNAKEKGERETQSARIKILNAYDMRSASRTMHEAMKRSSSLAARSALISCFQSKIREESDMDGMYNAFEDMYKLYKRNGDTLAMNIAQMLGRKLHNKGDDRIREVDSSDKSIYVPSNYY